MLYIFIKSLFALDLTIGTHHIVDRNTGELTLSGLGRELAVMVKRSDVWRDPSEDPTVTFVNNTNGFTIMIGKDSKLCVLGGKHLNICPVNIRTPDFGDDFRLVIGARGTSIRNKRNCLKSKPKDARRNMQELIIVPCRGNDYSFFDIISTTDSPPQPPPPNNFDSWWKNPFSW